MAQNLEGQLKEILVNLRSNIKGIRGSVVASSDGLPIAYDLEEDSNIDIISAMSATIQGTVSRAVTRLTQSKMEITLVTVADGAMAICNVADNASLLVLFEREVKLISALEELKKAVHRIVHILGFDKA